MKNRFVLLFVLFSISGFAQRVPNEMENIDYLMTFGNQAPTSTGDDDHIQIFFVAIPYAYKEPLYIRVYDPDIAGEHDELVGSANTKTKFSVYGGVGAFSNKEAQGINPVGNYKSGNLINSKVFAQEKEFDSNWYTFGPLNSAEGEDVPAVKGYVFKFIIEGLQGDDGNAYRLYISSNATQNNSITGGNAFGYEYTFKLPHPKGVSHIYPFIDKSVVSVTQHNFDFDKEGEIVIYSVAKNRQAAESSGDNAWAKSTHQMTEAEKNTIIDCQILKNIASDNTLSVYFLNQYNEAVPFFCVPIGGALKFKYDLRIGKKTGNK
jgi:hypothetical protein